MRDDMDHLMAPLATIGPERSLDGFEQAVLHGVAKRREDSRYGDGFAFAYDFTTLEQLLADF